MTEEEKLKVQLADLFSERELCQNRIAQLNNAIVDTHAELRILRRITKEIKCQKQTTNPE